MRGARVHGVPCGMRGARVCGAQVCGARVCGARVCGARMHVLIHGVPSVSGTRVVRMWDAWCAVWDVLSADAWCAVRDAWCTGVWCAGVGCVERLRYAGARSYSWRIVMFWNNEICIGKMPPYLLLGKGE